VNLTPFQIPNYFLVNWTLLDWYSIFAARTWGNFNRSNFLTRLEGFKFYITSLNIFRSPWMGDRHIAKPPSTRRNNNYELPLWNVWREGCLLWHLLDILGETTKHIRSTGVMCAARIFLRFLEVGSDWVHLVRRPLTGLLHQPRMIDDEWGALGGMRIDRGNRSTRRKPVPVIFSPPQIPHDLTCARTRAAAVGSRRLTAWATARP
jgi:hypothetical protein